MIRLYHHPNCDRCKQARRWLAQQGIDAETLDLREQAPEPAELARMAGLLGDRKRLLNTSGRAYRQPGMKERLAGADDDSFFALLAADGLLVKRPFLLTAESGTTGFDPEAWASLLRIS
jgi:arsenate reductase